MSDLSDGGNGPSTANVLTGPFEAKLEQPIVIYDNTLREGEQPPGVVFTADEKFEIAQALDRAGVPWANVGFPVVSAEERAAVTRIVKAGMKMKTAALTRMVVEEIDATLDTGVDLVALFLGSSDVHLKTKLRLTEAAALERIEQAVGRVRERGGHCSFALEDGSRTPLPRVIEMFKVAQTAGADYLVLADTVGILTPTTTHRIVGILTALFKTPIGLHFHNDLGLALANSLAGLEAGAQMVHATVNGVGERAGNTCLEELAVVLNVKYGKDPGIKLEQLCALSAMVHRASGTRVSEHKPIVGRWNFTHESGIHVAGVLADPESYQPFPPRMIGRKHELVFGKHSGAQGVVHLARSAGITLSEAAQKRVLARVRAFAERKQGLLGESQILDWIREEQ